MLETIMQAAKNFCEHQLQESCTPQDGVTKGKTLIAYIDIQTHDKTAYRVYLAAQKTFVQKVAKLFLEEDESDEATLQDMLLETTNLIVGSAKVLAEENMNKTFNITTPKFEKSGPFDFQVDKILTLKTEDTALSIAIKELNA
jgi:chemotaxis protein CheY-P-specific phosphatase CheC